MFTLIIKRLDGSEYWRDYFVSQKLLQAWLTEEQTRPYWDATFTTEIIEPTFAPKPTPLEVCQRLRALAYPSMEDYLDAIVKNDSNQAAKYIADCLAVKARYPKP